MPPQLKVNEGALRGGGPGAGRGAGKAKSEALLCQPWGRTAFLFSTSLACARGAPPAPLFPIDIVLGGWVGGGGGEGGGVREGG